MGNVTEFLRWRDQNQPRAATAPTATSPQLNFAPDIEKRISTTPHASDSTEECNETWAEVTATQVPGNCLGDSQNLYLLVACFLTIITSGMSTGLCQPCLVV